MIDGHMNRVGVASTDASRQAVVAEFQKAFESEATFRAWYDRTLPRVYAFLASRCGGPGPLAEELTQQTFVEAVRDARRFNGRSDPMTWLLAIGRHKLADHFRALERDERRRLRITVAEIAPATNLTDLDTSDERDAIERALQTLPAAQQAALLFRHLDGLSVAEIARLLRRSDSAVESLLARARLGFRAAYEGRRRG
jgi:RNA polymerase sigma-70 factor (ECF subfamily)